eukprot:CAMPEP_0197650896 /NCGR_PEP_ID=MMETSP1338-20131121/31226_1 /TAXON_ID=43686 ORGANISM="Pelagodinium beii, Strain RCC1491" /NCGR_SAMPLE_ID=MMETSP1338 /ASSEMBLY_ACC=CAM_ASM_000754 /LENGTH=323 /DNA_ID=CAMNT_0043225405 /DNA_START=97 /DNA_END=1068 /DNA_ORIENTATION=-
MEPRRVHIQAVPERFAPAMVKPHCMELPSAPGEWAETVRAVAPLLSAEQLHQALGILNQALINSNQVKAIEELQAAGIPGGPWPFLSFADDLKLQVFEKQQALLHELHQLQWKSCGSQANICTAAVIPPKVRAGQSQKVEAQLMPEQDAWQWEEKCTEKGGQRQAQTLSSSLQLLSNEDPNCLFIVRRINKLGFKASKKLRQYFSKFGTVVRVLVAHSSVRQYGETQSCRQRPSSLGFVQMASASAVTSILKSGEEIEVEGAVIKVQKFERQQQTEEQDDGVQALNEGQLQGQAKARQTSSLLSSASTCGSGSHEAEWRCVGA